MNCWNLLGIDATNNIAEIRKAYATKLKQHHPEEDPEGFARLHEAYKEALKISKNINGKIDNFVYLNEPVPSIEFMTDADLDFDNTDTINPQIEEQEPKVTLFNRLEAIYANVFKRIQIESWKELFSSLTIDEQIEMSKIAGRFFNLHYHIPKRVWEYIDQQLDLSKNSEFRLHDLLLGRYYLDYDFIKNVPSFEYDIFFEHRLNAIRAFYNNKFEEAIAQTKKANELYSNDPMLLFVQGGCAYQQNKMKSAIKYADLALAINPKLECALFMRAKAYFEIKKLRQAQKDCKTAYALNPKSEKIKQLTKLINCEIAKDKRKKILVFIPILTISVLITIGIFQTEYDIKNLYLSQPMETNSHPYLYTVQPSESIVISYQKNLFKISKIEIRTDDGNTKHITSSSNPDAVYVIYTYINDAFNNPNYDINARENFLSNLIYSIYVYSGSERFSFDLKESSDQKTYFFSSDAGQYVITQDEFDAFEKWFNSLN